MPDLRGIKNKIEESIKKIKGHEARGGFGAVEKEGGGEKVERAAADGAARREVLEEIIKAEMSGAATGISGAAQQLVKEQEKQIEKTLEEGLEEIYLSMPPDKQAQFRAAGEETAKKINGLLAHAKIKIKKIIALIKKWLSIIPGINKFFLEQEAKIKVDKIVKLRSKN